MTAELLFPGADVLRYLVPLIEWARANWMTLALTGEVVGAVVCVKMGFYRRGLAFLAAVLGTVWAGAI